MFSHARKLFCFLLLGLIPIFVEAACQSCIFVPVHHHHHRHHQGALWGRISTVIQQSTGHATWKQIAAHKVSRSMASKPVMACTAIGVSCLVPLAVAQRRNSGRLLLSTDTDDDDEAAGGTEENSDGTKSKSKPVENTVSTGMISALGVYKTFISPLLPPACRFVPTCSQYGVQAIQEFGPSKGSVLIAWRLLRCSPFGGKGYDPPQWPPVSYTYGSW